MKNVFVKYGLFAIVGITLTLFITGFDYIMENFRKTGFLIILFFALIYAVFDLLRFLKKSRKTKNRKKNETDSEKK
ncbi:MAG: hypothetical protein R6W70_08680 [bacterium]